MSGSALPATARRAAVVTFFRRIVKEKPLGTVGAAITALLLLVGIFADVLTPYGMNQTNMERALAAPSDSNWLGTDDLGRDVLTRVIYGARVSVVVGLAGATLATLISLLIGLISGYLGGTFDLLLQRLVDAWMSLPGLIVLMVIISFIGGGMMAIIVVLGIEGGITGSRIIRGAVISTKEDAYVTAASAIGGRTSRVLLRHILPNVLAPAVILLTLRIPAIILAEASLSFLGFGIQPPFPSWGAMLSGRSREFMFVAPWTVLWPGLALATVVYGTNMFGDAARDILDPKLRGGVGRFGVKAVKAAPPRGQRPGGRRGRLTRERRGR